MKYSKYFGSKQRRFIKSESILAPKGASHFKNENIRCDITTITVSQWRPQEIMTEKNKNKKAFLKKNYFPKTLKFFLSKFVQLSCLACSSWREFTKTPRKILRYQP